jgi:HTH-type transcriptional regulator/antitoxin HigA
LCDFWIKFPDCEQQLKAWYQEAESSVWKGPRDIKSNYPSASFLSDNRVVFNIKGNHYRLIVKVNYSFKIVWIWFLGTHSQYDRQLYKIMTIKPIKTNKDYKAAMGRLEVLFDAKPGSKEGDELEVWSILIEQYEQTHFPIEMPDPIEAIRFRMEQLGYNQSELAAVVGLKSRVSELLSKKRKLTLEMIRQLHQQLNIPTDVLIQRY